MKFFLLEQFNRLELFIKECEIYEASWAEKVAVVMTYNALFVYIFFGITAVYTNRTLFHYLLWTGFTLTSIGVTAASEWLPMGSLTPAVCSQTGITVCAEASILAYVLLFFFFYHLNHVESGWGYTGFLFLMLMVMGMTSFMSLLVLELFTMEEIGVGSIIGAVVAIFMSLIGLCFMEPIFEKGGLRGVASKLHLDTDTYA